MAYKPYPTSHLPGFTPEVGEGLAFEALATLLQDKREEEGPKPTADGTLFRGSNALGCTRRIAFEALQVEPAVGIDTATLTSFDIGRMYHELIQAALEREHQAQCEVPVSWRAVGHNISGHADAAYDRRCAEIKSMKAFAWSLATEGNGYDHTGPGPKREHLVQAGIYAMSPQIDAAELHMIYVNKDTGQLAEWVLGVHEPLVHLGDGGTTTIAKEVRKELARLDEIEAQLVAGVMPAREIPGYGPVDHLPPPAGSKGKPWNCRYCPYQPICKDQPPESFSLEVTPWSLPTSSSTSPSSTDSPTAS
jgi:hypothetical protein